MSDYPLDRLRAICLALPEAIETGGVGNPSFKVRDKIFAMQHGVNGRPSMWCKAPPGAQPVIGIDNVAMRRQSAEAAGADHAIDPSTGDARQQLSQHLNSSGAEIVAGGSQHASWHGYSVPSRDTELLP